MSRRLMGLLLVLILFSSSGLAVLPTAITYQGRLVENGVPVNGAREVTFLVYDDEVVDPFDMLMFTETDVVICNDGLFSTTLGDSDAAAFVGALSGGQAWLQVVVEGSDMGARQQLIAVPYAVDAEYARLLADQGMVGGASSPQAAKEWTCPSWCWVPC